MLPAISVTKTRCKMRINGESNRCQLRATDIIDYLKQAKKPDAICTVAVTMVDLYPRDSWNFVFGNHVNLLNHDSQFQVKSYSSLHSFTAFLHWQHLPTSPGLASLTNGVGVFSFARYTDSFYSELCSKDRLDNYITPAVSDKLLWRACKVCCNNITTLYCNALILQHFVATLILQHYYYNITITTLCCNTNITTICCNINITTLCCNTNITTICCNTSITTLCSHKYPKHLTSFPLYKRV